MRSDGGKKQAVNQGVYSFKRENVSVQKKESRKRSEYPEGEIILRLPERKFIVILDSG